MCGLIAVDLKTLPEHVQKSWDPNLPLQKIKYRGIEAYTAYKQWSSMYLGHVCLPFVNLDPKIATQPIDINGDYSLFVGEIFNWKELNENNSKTDGELFAKAIKNKDMDLIHNFDGFWSYVAVKNNKLFGMTDYLSQKPLYYRTDCEAIASEIDVLKDIKEVTYDLIYKSNVGKWGYCPDNRSPYNEIKQIPPGCYYYDKQIKPYWDWSKIKYTNLKDMMYQSVKNRLTGERKVAVLLSGGLDSTIVYKIIKDLGYETKPIHIDNNEEEYVQWFCNDYEKVSLDHIDLDESMKIHQVPVDLGSVRHQIAMAQKIRELGYYSVMTGDGADELFGGYSRSLDYDSQYSDVFIELPYYHLPKLDRCMMRYTVETRTPFLAPCIVKYALDLPYEQRKGRKQNLKHVFQDLVPDKILNRNKLPLKSPEVANDPLNIGRKHRHKMAEIFYEQMG